MKYFFIFLIRLYQLFLSPIQIILQGNTRNCRFFPSCSEYARDAFHHHSSGRAFFLTITRIIRCHPFQKGGYDPVPEPPARCGADPV